MERLLGSDFNEIKKRVNQMWMKTLRKPEEQFTAESQVVFMEIVDSMLKPKFIPVLSYGLELVIPTKSLLNQFFFFFFSKENVKAGFIYSSECTSCGNIVQFLIIDHIFPNREPHNFPLVHLNLYNNINCYCYTQDCYQSKVRQTRKF